MRNRQITSSLDGLLQFKAKPSLQYALGPWQIEDRMNSSRSKMRESKKIQPVIQRVASNLEIINTGRDMHNQNSMQRIKYKKLDRFKEGYLISKGGRQIRFTAAQTKKVVELNPGKLTCRHLHPRHLVLPSIAKPLKRQYKFINDEVIHLQNFHR